MDEIDEVDVAAQSHRRHDLDRVLSQRHRERGARRRVLHLTYTRRDLSQQLVQRDYLTQELYERLSPAHRFLMDVEPDAAMATPRKSAGRAGAAGWWN